MSNKEDDKILAFDTLFTNNHIQMMKIIMPFLDSSKQRYIAIYIKYLELRYTISYFQTNPFPPFPRITDSLQICQEILPYCSPEEKKRMEQMENLFSVMRNYQEMMEMFSAMQDIFPTGEDGFNPEMLSGLLGKDASQFFEMFQNMNMT